MLGPMLSPGVLPQASKPGFPPLPPSFLARHRVPTKAPCKGSLSSLMDDVAACGWSQGAGMCLRRGSANHLDGTDSLTANSVVAAGDPWCSPALGTTGIHVSMMCPWGHVNLGSHFPRNQGGKDHPRLIRNTSLGMQGGTLTSQATSQLQWYPAGSEGMDGS